MKTATNWRPRGESMEQAIERKLLANQPLSEYEVAALFGVTRTRIHQIEQRALRKMHSELRKDEDELLG